MSAPAAAPAADAKPQSLDELMLAMDVVDTIRHSELLVARELGQGERDAALRDRLREIYRSQGIEVADRVIDEGIRALKESRFVYTPPPPSFARTLALLWVRRSRIALIAGVLFGALVLGWGAYQFGVVAPREQAAESARAELAALPGRLQTAYDAVLAEARVDEARTQADALLSDGQAALARGDGAGASMALAALERLRAKLVETYELRIVSRPGEASGVWRIPEANPRGRNYYLIVEAIGPDGGPLTLPIQSEEEQETANVARWGVRVPEDVFESVRADKQDDGIIQNNVLGEKRRGELAPRYRMSVLGGAITELE
jgi:hypothetical protein